AHGVFDRGEEAFPLVDRQVDRELAFVAELLVEGLAADPGGGGDVAHRHLRPGSGFEVVPGGVEERLPEQGAGRLGGGRSACHPPYRRSGGGQAASSTGSKSTLSRTPQSGQAQSSGTSAQAVPGGKPSREWPCASS